MFLTVIPLQAQNFSTTNLQLFYGFDFDDPLFGYNTKDGDMFNFQLEHYGTWKYGDHYFFVQFFKGEFLDFAGNPTNERYRMYGEYTARFSICRILNNKTSEGVIKDVLLAAQFNQGSSNFHATLLGLGFTFNIKGFNVLDVNTFYKNDNFGTETLQMTTIWQIPIPIGKARFSFDGYFDLSGNDFYGTDFITEPKLLWDIGNCFSKESVGKVQVGCDWYIHKNDLVKTSAPQLVFKWSW